MRKAQHLAVRQTTRSSNAFALPSITSRASCCGFDRATAVMPCTKSKTLSGGRPSSARTVSTIRPVSAFENPRFLRKSCRSSSDRATIFSRAARMPSMKGAGEDSAKRLSAGVASWAKREAAYFECRIVISWKSSTPQRLRFWQTARR